MYVRYARHNDKNGMLQTLKFFGPFKDRLSAIAWIQAEGGMPLEWDYNDGKIGSWSTNPEEPLQVFIIIDEIPVEAP